MDRQQLREYLDQLSATVSSLDVADQEREKLTRLIEDLEAQLAADALFTESGSLVEQVDDMVSAFEAKHPTISGILNNILVTLTSMGV